VKVCVGIDSVEEKAWENYVTEHPEGNIFQTPQMYRVYTRTNFYEPVVLFALEDGIIKGLLIALIQDGRNLLYRIFTTRAIIFGGPVADNAKIWSILLKEYESITYNKVIYTQIRNFYEHDISRRNLITSIGYSFDDHLNIWVNLSVSEAEYWKSIKKNRKDGINKARKQNFNFEATSKTKCIDEFYSLLSESYKRIRLPYPDKSFFISLGEYLKDEIIWFILKKENKPIIILLALKYKQVIQAYYIGITRDPIVLNLRPVDLFYYEVMLWGIRNGMKTFDWMGAGKPDREYGVRKFKLQYGGDVINMGRYLRIHKPMIYKISKIGFKVWQSVM